MSLIQFPSYPFPMTVIGQTRTSSFSTKLRCYGELYDVTFNPELLSACFEGIANENDAPEDIAAVMDQLLIALEVSLIESGRFIFGYELEVKEGQIDLYVLVERAL